MSKSKSYVLTAGGSGGHVFPAIAVAEALMELEPEASLVFIGAGTPIERKLLEDKSWRYEIVESSAVRGKGVAGFFRLITGFFKNFLIARRILAKCSPSSVIGFGGYPTVVPLLAAFSKGLPCYIQEQNKDVGLANSFLSLFATKIFAIVGAKGFWRDSRVEEIANPVRSLFSQIKDWRPPENGKPFRLLILGGSQGAVSLNDEILKLVPLFREFKLEVVHQAGQRDEGRVLSQYNELGFEANVLSFVSDIDTQYRDAHLIICRAGAMTAAEVSESGRPAVYVPLPIAGGHQKKNVEKLCEAGAALMFTHGESLNQELSSALRELLSDMSLLADMASKARSFARSKGVPSAQLIANVLCSDKECGNREQ